MLGEIDLHQWRCLAELIDNSIDGFLHAAREGHVVEHPDIAVAIPSADNDAARVRIKDNGPGMSLETLENAVKAGWSGNDPLSSLGLFGMGFNIATARLGLVAEVWTSRAGDPRGRRRPHRPGGAPGVPQLQGPQANPRQGGPQRPRDRDRHIAPEAPPARVPRACGQPHDDPQASGANVLGAARRVRRWTNQAHPQRHTHRAAAPLRMEPVALRRPAGRKHRGSRPPDRRASRAPTLLHPLYADAGGRRGDLPDREPELQRRGDPQTDQGLGRPPKIPAQHGVRHRLHPERAKDRDRKQRPVQVERRRHGGGRVSHRRPPQPRPFRWRDTHGPLPGQLHQGPV